MKKQNETEASQTSSSHDVPEAPKLAPAVRPQPPHGSTTAEQGSYSKIAIAGSAAGSFTGPIIAMTLGGYWLDKKLHHATSYLTVVGMLLGLIVGVVSIARILRKLND